MGWGWRLEQALPTSRFSISPRPSSIQDDPKKPPNECLLVRTAVCCLALGRSRYNTNTARHTRRRGSSRDTGNGVSRYYGTVRSVEKCKLGWYEYVYF